MGTSFPLFHDWDPIQVSQFLHAYYTIDTEYLIKILNVRSVVASLRQVGPEELRPVETMVCGGMAGVCFWTCIFPLDVIKSRIQVTQLCSMCLYGVLFM